MLLAANCSRFLQACSGHVPPPRGGGGSSHSNLQPVAICKRQSSSLLSGQMLFWLTAVCIAKRQHAMALSPQPLPHRTIAAPVPNLVRDSRCPGLLLARCWPCWPTAVTAIGARTIGPSRLPHAQQPPCQPHCTAPDRPRPPQPHSYCPKPAWNLVIEVKTHSWTPPQGPSMPFLASNPATSGPSQPARTGDCKSSKPPDHLGHLPGPPEATPPPAWCGRRPP